MSRLLLLFDIDGTLLHGATAAHQQAMYEALAAVHGVRASGRSMHVVSPAGRTDPEIARAILLALGVSADRIDERADEVRIRCSEAYARLCPADLSQFVLPGVVELLESLGPRDNAILALVTGNYEAVARLKLARAGIGFYFKSGQGAFGSDAEDRAALPGIARRRAGSVGHPHPREAAIVVGDTPRDIACAAADGVRCFAVASGPFGREQLTGAAAVFENAEELAAGLASELAIAG